ncbi:MAG: fibronectin type III domain-containing protein [Candidatus Nanopelagicales bacterium]
MAAYSARGLRRRRARLAAGAVVLTAGLLSTYAAALRAVPTFAASPVSTRGGSLMPRTSPACDTTVSDDTTLRAAVASSVDDSVICLSADITLSAPLELDDTSVTFAGDSSGAPITLTAPLGDRHIYANFDDTQQDQVYVTELTLVGGTSSGGGGSIYLKGNFKDKVSLTDDTFMGNSATGNGGAVYATAPDEVQVEMRAVTMTDNSAAAGGAIAVHSQSGQATAVAISFPGEPGLFADDTATTGNGGAFYVSSHDGQAVAAVLGDVEMSHNTSVSGSGGAIATHADVVNQVDYLYFTSATLVLGGAFYLNFGTPTFTNNVAALKGGAIYSNGAAFTSLPQVFGDYGTGGVFTSNGAYMGGAIAAPYVAVYRSRFTDNYATLAGGAVALDDSISAIDDTVGSGVRSSLFTGNLSRSGGAIYAHAQSAYLRVDSSTFAANYAANSGGAIYLGSPAYGASLGLENSTLVDNGADYAGGAFVRGPATASFATVTSNRDYPSGPNGSGGIVAESLDASNSIFWANVAQDDSDVNVAIASSARYSLFTSSASYSAQIDDTTGTIVGQDPQLGPLQNNGGAYAGDIPILTMLLPPSSPAHGAANPDQAGFSPFDERGEGFARSFATGADMGATQIQFGVNGATPSSGPIYGGTPVILEGAGFLGATGVRFAGQPIPYTVLDSSRIAIVTPSGALGPASVSVSTADDTATLSNAFTFVLPPPPTPQAPGAPLDVTAVAGDASASVAWAAPTSPGSSPITSYRVTASPGGQTCASAELTCSVTGLTNGSRYTFTVQAENAEGYGPMSAPSNPVTPSATPVAKSIVIVGSRDASAAQPAITVKGMTTGLGRTTVVPHVRFPGEARYREGVARPRVNASGAFSWSRKTGKKTYVYFTSGTTASNRVVIPAQGLASRAQTHPLDEPRSPLPWQTTSPDSSHDSWAQLVSTIRSLFGRSIP